MRRQILGSERARSAASIPGPRPASRRGRLRGSPIKVASIYTVPVEQQWVSRIHKALNAAKDRGDVTYK